MVNGEQMQTILKYYPHPIDMLANPKGENYMKFKIGDRVRGTRSDVFTGTIIHIDSEYLHVIRDDNQLGGGRKGSWVTPPADLELIHNNLWTGGKIEKKVMPL
jgi:hypothetical protein